MFYWNLFLLFLNINFAYFYLMMTSIYEFQIIFFCIYKWFLLTSKYSRHYGLACPIYTHFTSPIRRYADVMVHRLLAVSIQVPGTRPWLSGGLQYSTQSFFLNSISVLRDMILLICFDFISFNFLLFYLVSFYYI